MCWFGGGPAKQQPAATTANSYRGGGGVAGGGGLHSLCTAKSHNRVVGGKVTTRLVLGLGSVAWRRGGGGGGGEWGVEGGACAVPEGRVGRRTRGSAEAEGTLNQSAEWGCGGREGTGGEGRAVRASAHTMWSPKVKCNAQQQHLGTYKQRQKSVTVRERMEEVPG